MSRWEARQCADRDGRPFVVRTAEEADAEAMIAYRLEEVRSHPFGVTRPEEVDTDPGAQRAWVRDHLEHGSSLCLLAEAGGELIGAINVHAPKRKVLEHRVTLGMSVAGPWRGRGVGRALLRAVLDWAKDHPVVEIVSLGAFATNERALALYRSEGFVEEGRRREFFHTESGEYVDDVLMSLRVKPRPDWGTKSLRD